MSQSDPAPRAASNATLADQVGQVTQAMELADPDEGAPPIDRWVNRLAEVIGVAVLAAIVLLVFFNAVGRYLFASPIIWAEEIVISLIPWLAMSGVFLSVRRRAVIRLEYFTLRLPPALRTGVELFIAIVSSATFVLLAFYSFQYVTLFGYDVTTYVKAPAWLFTSSMFIGAAAVVIAFLVNGYRELKADRAPIGADRL
jgi:TRAP-type C4-dicarboxylate transport system permease small subunit